MRNNTSNNRVLVALLALACLTSNLSQLPILVDAGITQYLNTPVWILLVVYLLCTNRLVLSRYSFMPIISLMLIFIGSILLEFLTENSYFSSSVFTCLLLSMFIFFLGDLSGRDVSREDLYIISSAYVISAVVVSIAIYFDSFSSGTGLNTMQYAYQSKNSVSQIIFTAIVILMFFKLEGRKFLNILRVLAIVGEVALLMLLRSRATIIGFLICLVYIIFTGTFDRRLRYALSALGVIFIFLLLTNDAVNNMFFNNILYAGRDATNLDSLTSGRVSILNTFPDLIEGNWITGIGATYFECFPLSVILNFGIFVGIPVFAIVYRPLIYAFQWRNGDEFSKIFLIVVIGYMINSIFEGLAPIGPGVKCYFMWLLFGILAQRDSLEQIEGFED